ncbi:MAG TPA: porin [Gammaproteobacteria bacterium]|nr:porin [Gammaproteobacteria bacterium]
MNKKLVVAVLGLGLVGVTGLASADLTLYGQLDLSLNFKNSDFKNANPLTGRPADPILALGDNINGVGDDINMGSNQSAVGFKGSEDLGNGLSAFFKVEYQTDIAGNGANTWQGRDQYIGLASDSYGKLTFGSMSTAYKSPGSKIDPFYRTSLQSRVWGLQSALHRGKGENGQGRTVNTLRYDSPSFYNVKLFGTYNFDQNKYDANDDDTYSIGAQYSGGNLFVAASYIDTQASGPKDTAAAQLIARYDWNAISFHGIYELDKGLITAARSQGLNSAGTVGGANDDGADLWSLGATYTIGNNLIGFDYGQGSDSKGSDGAGNAADNLQEYDSWRIAAYHKFSARTRLYAGYVNQDFKDSGEQDLFSLGMRHNF